MIIGGVVSTADALRASYQVADFIAGLQKAMSRLQAQAEEMKSGLALIAVDYGAIGVTAFSLVMLLIQLGYAGEMYRPRHTILLSAALAGFVGHVVTTRVLLQRGLGQRQGKLTRNDTELRKD